MSCERVSDRMAAVAAGESWTVEEADHLTRCPACGEEWRLFQLGRGLGAGLPIDVDGVVARVHKRLAERPAVPIGRFRRPIRWAAGLAAAALVIVAVRAARVDPAARSAPPPAPTALVLTELDDLTSSELDDLLGDLGDDEVPSPAMGISGFNDLSADELERVLRDWES